MKLRPGTPEEVGMSVTRIRHVADLAQNWVNQGVTPALVVLVARRGVIVLHGAFGRLTPDADAPLLPRDAIFPMASITKLITATAAMILVEEGRLGLNRPVVEYIPEFVGKGKEAVMVHHLLTHTSGLTDEQMWSHADQKKAAIGNIPPATETQHSGLSQWLFLGYDMPLWKAPGQEMAYCDYGFEIVGEIVQRVSGKPLPDFASERIFAPLGMQDTWYIVPNSVRHRIVKRLPDAFLATPKSPSMQALPSILKSVFSGIESPEFPEWPGASSGVYSTVPAMATFGQMFLNHGRYGDMPILSPTTVAMMTRNQIPGIGAEYHGEHLPEANWGIGWGIHGQKKAMYDGTLYSPQAFSHSGAGGVQLWVDPLYELVGVYFSVVLRATYDGHHPVWPVDLFMNAVTAAIDE